LPAAFVELDALPLTPNGKVDLRALPAPGSGSRTGPDLVLPRNELERSLAKIWSEVLGVERVGINDNFFELGGHSLLMVKVHGQVQELVRREISIVEMFRYPTISLLAAYLSSGTDTAHELHTKSAARAVRQQAAIQQQQQRMQAISQRRRSTNQHG
ncbi:MAG: non-ribosomal peptide synthetase, partial [Oscillochloris sp.]|nr:non-ribosomal peptide synthetase [Oscillochloris sp.]